MIVGVLGGGQLGRMLAQAGRRLGLKFRILDPDPGACAGAFGEHLVGEYNDPRVLRRFVDGLSVATFEFENVPVDAVKWIGGRCPLYPPPEALEIGQDRLAEKHLFERLKIPVPVWRAVSTHDELKSAAQLVGLPAVLKTRRLGYDGKGQFVLSHASDIDRAWDTLHGGSFVLEKFIPFERELSILAVRRKSGETRYYPLVENHHRSGILRWSCAPAPHVSAALQIQAHRHASAVLDAMNYVGVLAIEFFESEGVLIANELAPRVHNSGHWTLDAAQTDQFTNHLRAILDLPLGETHAVCCSAMLNLIGEVPRLETYSERYKAVVHLYGKTPRPERKLGHVTICGTTVDQVESALHEMRAVLKCD